MPISSAERFTAACNVLVNAEKEVKAILTDPNDNQLLLFTTSSLERIITRLQFLSGATPQAIKTSRKFGPIKDFMGEKMEFPKKLTAEDLTPQEHDKKIFLDKVNRLYAQIDTLFPDAVINAHTIPEDVIVLRGVAKKAGVEGYDEKEINIPFIEEIVKAIKDKDAAKLSQEQIDNALLQQDSKNEAALTSQEVKKQFPASPNKKPAKK